MYVEELMKLAESNRDIEEVSWENWGNGQWMCWIESYDCHHDGTGPSWEKSAENALTSYKEIHNAQ